MLTPKQVLKQAYGSKLGDSRWKEFATRMRRTKGNFCNCCRQGNKVTQVHHLFYDENREPWEYSQEEVVILCESCHKQIHEQLKKFRKFVFQHLTPASFQVLNGALAVGLSHNDPLTFVHALAEFASSKRNVENFSKAWMPDKPDIDLTEAVKKLPPLPTPKRMEIPK